MNYVREYYNAIQRGEIVVSHKVESVYRFLVGEIDSTAPEIIRTQRPVFCCYCKKMLVCDDYCYTKKSPFCYIKIVQANYNGKVIFIFSELEF